MSQRFGRNQRRRAREEQERLTTALNMQRELAEHIGKQKRDVESELQDAKEFAAPFSAAFAPEAWEIDGPRRGRLEIEERQPFDFNAAVSSIPEMATFRRLPLRVLLADVETDRFRQSLHCRVQFGDGTWAYGVTEMALQQMPRRRLVETIARSIAEQIARDIR